MKQQHKITRIAALFLALAIAASSGWAAVNPAPFINEISPMAALPGASAFTLTVNGTGYVPGAQVYWTRQTAVFHLTTTFVSATELTAEVPSFLVIAAGKASVTVVNPSAPASNVQFFQITAPTSGVAFSTASTPRVGSEPVSVAVCDFNGDGRLDLAVANLGDQNVSILLGNGDGTFTAAAKSPVAVGYEPVSVAVGDFNGDGKPDLAVAKLADNNVSILLGNGDGTFTAATGSPVSVGNRPRSLAVGDFNGDGNLDLAVANFADNTVSILLGKGDGTFTAATGSPVGVVNTPYSVVVGDFNGDGKLDLAVANLADNNVSILLGNGDGTFTAAAGSPVSVVSSPESVAVGDFNGDSKLDLSVANYQANSVSILLGNGDGTFTSATGSPVGAGGAPDSVAVGDFNGDGKLDLAVANQCAISIPFCQAFPGAVSILLGNGDGTFTAATGSPVGVGVSPASVAVGDFNGDGRLDIASANYASSNVTILVQEPFALSPSNSLSFGNQNVGSSSSTQSVTLSAGLAVDITSIAFSTGSADFQLVTTASSCPYSGGTLAAGENCTVDLQFAPTAAGPLTGTVTVTGHSGGAADSTQTISLSGTGVSVPTASVSPIDLVFIIQPEGTTSAAQTVTLSNIGTAALSISSITPSGNFAQTNTCGSSLAAGSNCSINVTFTPQSTGNLGGQLIITDNNNGTTGSTQIVTLSGTGTAPMASVSPISLSFGNQPVGTTSAAQTVTLSNTGSSALTISSTSISSGNFSISSNNCGNSLAQNSSCQIGITFMPASTGMLTGSLTFTDNSGGTTGAMQSIGLSGTGIARTQTITFNMIPNQVQGTALALTATASSGLPVSYTSSTPTVCTVSGSTATFVLPGTCTIVASQNGNNVYAAATQVAQSFTVIPSANFTITPNPASETIYRGRLAAFLLVLKSVNGFKGKVTVSCSGGPTGSQCADLPQTVQVNGTAYAISGILFPTSTPPGTYTMTFTGVSGSLTNKATATFIVK